MTESVAQRPENLKGATESLLCGKCGRAARRRRRRDGELYREPRGQCQRRRSTAYQKRPRRSRAVREPPRESSGRASFGAEEDARRDALRGGGDGVVWTLSHAGIGVAAVGRSGARACNSVLVRSLYGCRICRCWLAGSEGVCRYDLNMVVHLHCFVGAFVISLLHFFL